MDWQCVHLSPEETLKSQTQRWENLCELKKQVCRKDMTFPTHQAMLIVKDFLNIYSLIADYLQCFVEGRI